MKVKKKEYTKLTPEEGYVVVKPDPKISNINGFTLPESVRVASKEGVVAWLPVGGHPTLRVGDRVLFHSNSGVEKTLQGEDYIVMMKAEIFSKIS